MRNSKLKELINKDLQAYIKRIRILDKATYLKKLENLINLRIFGWGKLKYEKYHYIFEHGVVDNYQEYQNMFKYELKIENQLEKDLNYIVDIKLGQALNFGKKKPIPIIYEQIIKCSDCVSLSANAKNFGFKKCQKCGGSGRTVKEVESICVACDGYGVLKIFQCEKCRDRQVYKIINKVDLLLGEEFHEGIVYSFQNMGNYDLLSQTYGTLRVKPNITDDYSQNGQVLLKVVNGTQVESEETVPVSTMALGGAFCINHALGQSEIRLDPNTQPGEYKVIGNLGIPQYYDKEEKEMQKGSQIVFFNPKLPSHKELEGNPRLKQLFQELKKYDDEHELNRLNKINL